MASKIKTPEWAILYIFAVAIDIFQKLIDAGLTEFFAAPEAANELIDLGVAGLLLIYFPKRGVPIFSHIGRFASMLGMEALAAATGGFASFWCVEIYYMQRTVRREEAEEEAIKGEQTVLAVGAAQQYVNTEDDDGIAVRLPSSTRAAAQKPRNLLDNIRPPNGGLSPA